MKKMLLIIFCILSLNAFSGDEVNNGGGAAEGTITYAFLNLSNYIDVCLVGNICRLNEHEKDIITNIKNSLSEEYAQEHPLIFLSENHNPGTFIINGEVKIAKTGDEIGTPIYFNTDLLYVRNNTDHFESIDIRRAIALLIHELGHHHEIEDHIFLDSLGAKVSMGTSTHMQVSSFFTFNDKLQIIIFNEKKEDSFPQIILKVDNDLIDITNNFKDKLKCSLIALPNWIDFLPYISVPLTPPKGAVLHNIHWTKNTQLEKLFTCTSDSPETCFDSSKVRMKNFYLKGNLSNLCGDNPSLIMGTKNYRAEIKFSAYVYETKSKDLKFKFKKDSVRVKQLWEPWWKLISLNLTSF